jgi:hypothetical protein
MASHAFFLCVHSIADPCSEIKIRITRLAVTDDRVTSKSRLIIPHASVLCIVQRSEMMIYNPLFFVNN